jgi:hypothetical protein
LLRQWAKIVCDKTDLYTVWGDVRPTSYKGAIAAS